MDDKLAYAVAVSILLGAFFIVSLLTSSSQAETIRSLGSAICSERLQSDFSHFEKGVVYCKPIIKQPQVQYDGLTVQYEED